MNGDSSPWGFLKQNYRKVAIISCENYPNCLQEKYAAIQKKVIIIITPLKMNSVTQENNRLICYLYIHSLWLCRHNRWLLTSVSRINHFNRTFRSPYTALLKAESRLSVDLPNRCLPVDFLCPCCCVQSPCPCAHCASFLSSSSSCECSTAWSRLCHLPWGTRFPHQQQLARTVSAPRASAAIPDDTTRHKLPTTEQLKGFVKEPNISIDFFYSTHHSMVLYFRCSVDWWKGSVRF